MIGEKISEKFDNGIVATPTGDKKAEILEWNEHAKFKGVFLKHLIKRFYIVTKAIDNQICGMLYCN